MPAKVTATRREASEGQRQRTTRSRQMPRMQHWIRCHRITLGFGRAREAKPAEHLADRRGRPLEDRSQHQRTCSYALPQLRDLGLALPREPPRLLFRCRGTVA